MVFLTTVLVVFNPWLILLLITAVPPAFLGESYFNDKIILSAEGKRLNGGNWTISGMLEQAKKTPKK